VTHSNKFQKRHALECLRLAADCQNLARSVVTPDYKSHFLQMADMWTSLAGETQGALKISSDAISLQRLN
jgi:hypothetical protein